jgi:hypothetical protein
VTSPPPDDPPPSGENLCDWCDQPPVAGINDRRACTDHLDAAFAEAATPLRRILAAWPDAYLEVHPDG